MKVSNTSSKRAARRANKFARTMFTLGSTIILILLTAVLIYVIIGHNRDSNAALGATAPDYAVSQLTIWSGEPLPSANAFLYESSRPLVNAARYLTMPGTEVGDQNIAILIQLNDGTTRTENTILTIKEPVIVWELGTEATLEDLLGSEFRGAELSISLDTITKVGSYDVTVTQFGKELPFTLLAQDTTPPVVTLRENLSFYVNQKLTAADFVESCEDLSAVEYHFSDEPSTLMNGSHSVQLIVTDACGNSQTLDVTYMVSGDGEAPEISGVTDMSTIAGIPISYMRGVSAEDANDGVTAVYAEEPEGFSIRTAGDYTITYTATDNAGNVATETATLHVLDSLDKVQELTEEDVYRIGDQIIFSLDLGDLGTRERLRKIYDYVQGHMFYHDNHDILDWQYAAVVAIYQGYGDCRNYYAFSRLLLSCADFENMMVEKPKPDEWTNAHYWNLVRVDGAWYHFDTTPRFDRSDFFLWTDAQMDAYSASHNNCFERDRSLYPATPES